MTGLLPNLAEIAGIYIVAVASPGPNFFMVSQLSLKGKRQLGFLAAFGITTGSSLWALLAMVGLSIVLAEMKWLYYGLRFGGALYLIYYGMKLLLSAGRVASGATEGRLNIPSSSAAFRDGLFTSLTNPKSGAFWTSIFATELPVHPPLWFCVCTFFAISVISASWHLGVAVLFASCRVQTAYRRLRRPIETISGSLLVGLGLRLAFRD